MQESGIPVPHHIKVNREGLGEGEDPPGFIETEDYVELDGVCPSAPCLLMTVLTPGLVNK